MITLQNKLTILKQIQDYIVPLTEAEFFQLESSILAEGCREPLIVWAKDDQTILIDGHNRFKICQKNSIPFKTKKLTFGDLEEVKIWMLDNQMGRRNLTPDQMSYYRGLKYLALKKKKGGYQNVISKGQNDSSTSEMLAGTFNVSESTVKRDAKFAEGLNIIARSNPKLKNKILAGAAKVNKSDIQSLSNSKNPEKVTIKNEADLFNKAKIIKEEILDDVERKIKKVEHDKFDKAQDILRSTEPIFTKREDRLQKIKGMILSAINRAIQTKNAQSIKELKKLVDKLADELFD